jgi:hypothetical protein
MGSIGVLLFVSPLHVQDAVLTGRAVQVHGLDADVAIAAIVTEAWK